MIVHHIYQTFLPRFIKVIVYETMAGLLAYLTFRGLPNLQLRVSGKGFRKAFLRLTAAGTAPDFNGIPILILSGINRK